MPASISSPMRSGVAEAGPRVQTIFARGIRRAAYTHLVRWVVVLSTLAGCNALYGLDETDLEPPVQIADEDGDTVADAVDNCRSTPNTDQHDEDADTIGDACDDCPLVPDPDQRDIGDGDGVGDRCDPHPVEAGDCLVRFDSFEGEFTGWDVTGATPQLAKGSVTLAPGATGATMLAHGLDGVYDVEVAGIVTLAEDAAFCAASNVTNARSGLECGVAHPPGIAVVGLLGEGGTEMQYYIGGVVGTVALLRLTSDIGGNTITCRLDYGVARNFLEQKRQTVPTTGNPGVIVRVSTAQITGIAIYQQRGSCP
jgi:hypothetical protein